MPSRYWQFQEDIGHTAFINSDALSALLRQSRRRVFLDTGRHSRSARLSHTYGTSTPFATSRYSPYAAPRAGSRRAAAAQIMPRRAISSTEAGQDFRANAGEISHLSPPPLYDNGDRR